ncbi:MAG: hypothetical protein ACLQVY_03230 [Limisphaerales bacterium]
MKQNHSFRSGRTALFALWTGAVALAAMDRTEAAPNLALWDTVAPLSGNFSTDNRTAWKAVPTDLLLLEADPPKARSDPGYYGREYAFKGDAVVENKNVTVVFSQSKGRAVIYAKESGKELLEICPLEAKARPMMISRYSVLRNTGDEFALEIRFAATGAPEVAETFIFDRSGVLEVKPVSGGEGVALSGPIAGGVVPSFIGDDLIYNAADYPEAKSLHVPSESFFVGLLQGEEHEFVMTWPKGRQHTTLQLSPAQSGERSIESVDFANDGQSLYLAFLDAPGLWHKEVLKPGYLEKDVAIQWKKPFPARWKTQLDEGGVKTTFTFKNTKEDIWRGVAGSYIYPVWFSDDAANYHLSKKVPPQGESLIYCLEPRDTPLSITTPADILTATLGRSMSESILDLEGRKLSTHHRRGGEGVHRACTCGCTEAIQSVFEAHEETARKGEIAGDIDDMIYFIHRHVERIDHYRSFADDLIRFLQAQEGSTPGLKPYVDNLVEIAGQISQEYNVQKENMASFAHADDLARQTLALAGKADPNNLKSYMELLEAWRKMGGAQDYVLAQCHVITRKLCQQAGYTCVDQPKAAALAEEIRARCRQCLRQPDGYEIWSDY